MLTLKLLSLVWISTKDTLIDAYIKIIKFSMD